MINLFISLSLYLHNQTHTHTYIYIYTPHCTYSPPTSHLRLMQIHTNKYRYLTQNSLCDGISPPTSYHHHHRPHQPALASWCSPTLVPCPPSVMVALLPTECESLPLSYPSMIGAGCISISLCMCWCGCSHSPYELKLNTSTASIICGL